MAARRRTAGRARRENGSMTGPVAGGAAEFEARLASFVQDKRLYGAAAGVVHFGELAWAGGAGFADITAQRPSQPDTLYRIASITKTFTGTAIMQLRDAGKLDLDDPAVDWLPELKASGSPKTIARVTIRRLLSHESGLTGDPPGTDWTLPVPVYEGRAERSLARAAEIFTAVPPSTQAKYSNLGYQLLGEIVRRASGTDYPAYLRAHVLTPLGLTATAFEPL
jgi:CubicO group peptidase (beta-lactamase class C family)